MPKCVVRPLITMRKTVNATPSAMSAGNARRYGPSGAWTSTMSHAIPMTRAT
jgi:hypothetical protein